ncbi:MAG: SANT/Myb domain-containing protein [Holosporales bacterium]|jgi:hypothetical protein|nr:SANT/Myb domain-containing protein [Holosporales bacterium]
MKIKMLLIIASCLECIDFGVCSDDTEEYTPIPPTRRKKPNKIGRFTPEEDAALLHGKKLGLNWTEIARDLPGRNARQCMDRYNHYLVNPQDEMRAPIPFNDQNDVVMLQMMKAGAGLDETARIFPNRSPAEIHQRCVLLLTRLVVLGKDPTLADYFAYINCPERTDEQIRTILVEGGFPFLELPEIARFRAEIASKLSQANLPVNFSPPEAASTE